MSGPTFLYCASRPCGCVVAARVDSPDRVKDTAKSISGWISDGLTVERKANGGASIWTKCGGHSTLTDDEWIAAMRDGGAR